MACTVDCLSTYKCGELNDPPAGAIYSPYVKLSFGSVSITVGNNSAPPDNMAAITSFQYGLQGGTVGWGADFEIIDMGGVMYERIIARVNASITDIAAEDIQTSFEFGWILKSCDGPPTIIKSPPLFGIILKVESTHEAGYVKLKMKVSAPTAKISETRHDNTIGDENNKVFFKDALERLFTENHPKVESIRLLDKDGAPMKFNASDGDIEKGPRGVWPMNQMNNLSIARNWWNSLTTNGGVGVIIVYDPKTRALVFKEDALGLTKNCCYEGNSMGTYVVNGGNCSPVLGFTPTVTWPKGLVPGAGATTGGAFSGNNDTSNGPNPVGVKSDAGIEEAGTQSSPTVQQQDLNWRSPDLLPSKASKAFAAQLKTNSIYELPNSGFGFGVELKIIGDPKYDSPLTVFGKNIAIVYINPFHIEECSWITTTNCNHTLSNKHYFIKEVNHQISGGSFITTLKLWLMAPNLNIPATSPLGACGDVFLPLSINGDANESQG